MMPPRNPWLPQTASAPTIALSLLIMLLLIIIIRIRHLPHLPSNPTSKRSVAWPKASGNSRIRWSCSCKRWSTLLCLVRPSATKTKSMACSFRVNRIRFQWFPMPELWCTITSDTKFLRLSPVISQLTIVSAFSFLITLLNLWIITGLSISMKARAALKNTWFLAIAQNSIANTRLFTCSRIFAESNGQVTMNTCVNNNAIRMNRSKMPSLVDPSVLVSADPTSRLIENSSMLMDGAMSGSNLAALLRNNDGAVAMPGFPPPPPGLTIDPSKIVRVQNTATLQTQPQLSSHLTLPPPQVLNGIVTVEQQKQLMVSQTILWVVLTWLNRLFAPYYFIEFEHSQYLHISSQILLCYRWNVFLLSISISRW